AQCCPQRRFAGQTVGQDHPRVDNLLHHQILRRQIKVQRLPQKDPCQVLLAGKVVVEATLRSAGGVNDAVDRRPAVSLGLKLSTRSVQESLPRPQGLVSCRQLLLLVTHRRPPTPHLPRKHRSYASTPHALIAADPRTVQRQSRT